MKRLLALILVLSMILCALASCGGNSSNNDDEETTKKKTYKFDDEEENEENGGKDDGENNNEAVENDGKSSDGEKNEKDTEKETEKSTVTNSSKYAHSETFYRAQKRWNGLWQFEAGFREKKTLLYSPAPFKFLNERGIVYYKSGEPRVYGVDDDFKNDIAIQARGFIDEKTDDNDFYLAVQCVCGAINVYGTNDDTAVYTAWLKYSNLPDDLYRDLLVYSNDCRVNLLIQQIDEEYTPKVLGESLIDFDSIGSHDFFKTENGIDQDIFLTPANSKAINFVEKIDYQGLNITVNYTDAKDISKIYSYTYNLKETPGWEECLVYNPIWGSITKEYRDALTNDEIMETYNIDAGKVLYKCRASGTPLDPSKEQKATATLKYDLTCLTVNTYTFYKYTADYENGKIKYEQVNDLTKAYEKNRGSALTQ